MHCPACGQQQISNETKFCSRCGMPLGVVAEVVSQGGYLPQLAQLDYKKPFFSKKNGVLFGVFWFIFLTMFSTAFLGILGAPEELIGIVAITGVFGALMIIIGSLIGLPSSKPPFQMPMGLDQANRAASLHAQRTQHALPQPPATAPSDFFAPKAGNWRDTNDLETSAITEGETRRLSEKDR